MSPERGPLAELGLLLDARGGGGSTALSLGWRPVCSEGQEERTSKHSEARSFSPPLVQARASPTAQGSWFQPQVGRADLNPCWRTDVCPCPSSSLPRVCPPGFAGLEALPFILKTVKFVYREKVFQNFTEAV